MKETSKSIARRLHTPGFARYFAGHGIDVGAGDDPLGQYRTLFPFMVDCRAWDKQDGDAQRLDGVKDASFDFLHSSHCLEHLIDPAMALYRWCKVVKRGGHIVVLVPDEDLYEQHVWPSRWNGDHKHTFTLCRRRSWSPVSINVFDLIASVGDLAEPVRAETLETTWRTDRPGQDQTADSPAESAIEFVLRRL